MTTEVKERTITERMIAVLAALPAIGKDQRNEQQKFMYRGHDDVMNALNPLLAEHGIFFVPSVLDRVTGERTTGKGSTMYEVNLHVRYRFYGAGGDYIEASAWGEGTDMGDKSTNKAMTMALKNVLAQAFAISTAELSDADGGSPEETRRGGQAQERMQTPRAAGTFNPARDLLPGAPKGTANEVSRDLVGVQKLIAADLDWSAILEEAATARLGPQSEWQEETGTEFMVRWANAVTKLYETASASDDWHDELGLKAGPAGDALVVEAFEWAFDVTPSLPLPKVAVAALTDEWAALADE